MHSFHTIFFATLPFRVAVKARLCGVEFLVLAPDRVELLFNVATFVLL